MSHAPFTVGIIQDSASADAGRDPAQALAAHETNGALRIVNALLPRRDTGTNVNDVVIGIVRRA